MFLSLRLLLFGFVLFIAQNVVASLPHCRCRPASSGNRVINAWNFHNRNEFPAPAPAASQARKHARSSLTVPHSPHTPPAFPTYCAPSCRDLATPLAVVVAVAALITNASRWQKSSWPSSAKQTKTSNVQELQQRAKRQRAGGRQQQSYGKTSTRLARTGEAFNCTSADRIRVAKSESESDRLSRLTGAWSRPIERGEVP